MRNRQHNNAYDPTTPRRQGTTSSVRRNRSGTSDVANDRGNYERLMALGDAAASAGDAIEAESLYQRAEHYLKKSREQGA